MWKNKKGLAIWISWVLMILFAVSVSAFMYTWMTDYANKNVKDTSETVYDTSECDSLGVSIDSVCQNATDLYISASNRNNLDVKNLIIRSYDAFNNPESAEKAVLLKPGYSTLLVLPKQGVKTRVEILPGTVKVDADGVRQIVCRSRAVTVDSVADC